ncbi:MAG: helix-turn-helix domain-containing protein [Massilibacteroides sp.]|nr:helix-turn-helix domain-containing protein [Massilibacteroides sp.]MDD3061874.1 helix-turn-helix domain-containing protein [Massilibacteroides sp.]MDD4115148.1 helix-turn-helix domain-containing protein [Massilibacteroides sp.]MDD4661249.1 helix-turn-helix domain-containing protein [Massilibacteroides sp.]
MNYAKITLDDLMRQSSTMGIKNFVISEEIAKINDYHFDLRYPHIIEGIAFAICVKGTARVKINLREYYIGANSIIIVLPNYILEILERSDDLSIKFLFFSFDFISDLKLIGGIDFVEKIGQRPYFKLNEDKIENLLEFHAFIVKQYKKENHLYREKIAKNLLYTLIYEVLHLYHDESIGDNDETLTRNEKHLHEFIELLYKYHKQERSIAFYANKMFITPKYLSYVIRETSGKNAQQWIDEMVIMVAKALLKSSNMTVSQISEEMNFANPSFFGSYFRKRTGMTPVQYRES